MIVHYIEKAGYVLAFVVMKRFVRRHIGVFIPVVSFQISYIPSGKH
jgi:hypothetical protein